MKSCAKHIHFKGLVKSYETYTLHNQVRVLSTVKLIDHEGYELDIDNFIITDRLYREIELGAPIELFFVRIKSGKKYNVVVYAAICKGERYYYPQETDKMVKQTSHMLTIRGQLMTNPATLVSAFFVVPIVSTIAAHFSLYIYFHEEYKTMPEWSAPVIGLLMLVWMFMPVIFRSRNIGFRQMKKILKDNGFSMKPKKEKKY